MFIKYSAKIMTIDDYFRNIGRMQEILEKEGINKKEIFQNKNSYCNGIREFNKIVKSNLKKGEIVMGIHSEPIDISPEDIILIKK